MRIATEQFTLQDFIEAVKKWREDVEPGRIYPTTLYPDFNSTPLSVLDPVCKTLNAQWKAEGSGFRVGYSKGEFYAGYQRQL